jgi:hypothetical protein
MGHAWRLVVVLVVAGAMLLGLSAPGQAAPDMVGGACMVGGMALYAYGSQMTHPSAIDVLSGADPFERQSESAMTLGVGLFAFGVIHQFTHKRSDTSLTGGEPLETPTALVVGCDLRRGKVSIGCQWAF